MHRKPTIRDRYGATVATFVAVFAIVLTAFVGGASSSTAGPTPTGVQLLASASTVEHTGRPSSRPINRAEAQVIAAGIGRTVAQVQAASTGDDGCRLSANWWVPASFNWSGRDFRYGVLNSPGALLVGGRPDGTRSEYFLFRGSERTWDGVYGTRDPAKAPRFVYRTLSESSLEPYRNVDRVVQVPIAPSGAFCLATRNR